MPENVERPGGIEPPTFSLGSGQPAKQINAPSEKQLRKSPNEINPAQSGGKTSAGRKQAWANRADRLEAWALAAETRAEAIYASQPEYARDPAFLTQPAHSSRGVARERARLNERQQRGWELEAKAKEHRAKAAELRRMASTNAGDAAAAKKAHWEGLTSILAVGDLVDSIYGVRRVVKINAKSLRLEGALGFVTIDKSLCRKVRA